MFISSVFLGSWKPWTCMLKKETFRDLNLHTWEKWKLIIFLHVKLYAVLAWLSFLNNLEASWYKIWKLIRGQKFHSFARNYKWNLERASNSSQSTLPVGRVLWEELLESYYKLLPYVLYCIHFKRTSACVCRMSENCKSLVLQDKCNIEIFCPLLIIGRRTSGVNFCFCPVIFFYTNMF